jgi:hypothetical protein
MVIFGLMIFLFALIWMLNIVSSYVYIVLLACGLIGRIFKINKKSRIILKKSRIIKKNVKILHLWTVVADVKSDAFTSAKMLPQM